MFFICKYFTRLYLKEHQFLMSNIEAFNIWHQKKSHEVFAIQKHVLCLLSHYHIRNTLLNRAVGNARMIPYIYRISTYSFRGNYSFLNSTLCNVTLGHSTYRCRNYSRAETIRGNMVYQFVAFCSFFPCSLTVFHRGRQKKK